MSAQVTVYSTPTCPWCDRAKDFLTKHDVPYEVKDVSRDQAAAMEMIRRTGQQGVPVITTPDEVILGFDQARLAQVAKKYGGPRRPPLGLLGADAESYLARRPELAETLGGPVKGVYVGEVKPGSVAEKSGLLKGDIVQAAAGKRVQNMRALDAIVDNVRAGHTLPVRVLRDGKDVELSFQF
jgi:glutaredoxin-like YruB-family protein